MKAPSSSLWNDYREGSRFFIKEGDVYETLRSLVARLDREGLDYAVIGAMALVAHGYRRFTEGVDILLTPEALRRFREKVEGLDYFPAFKGAKKTFRDSRTRVKVEVMTTGEYPGDGKPKPVAFPDPVQSREKKEDLWGHRSREADRAQARVGTYGSSPTQGFGGCPGAHPSPPPSAGACRTPRWKRSRRVQETLGRRGSRSSYRGKPLTTTNLG